MQKILNNIQLQEEKYILCLKSNKYAILTYFLIYFVYKSLINKTVNLVVKRFLYVTFIKMGFSSDDVDFIGIAVFFYHGFYPKCCPPRSIVRRRQNVLVL